MNVYDYLNTDKFMKRRKMIDKDDRLPSEYTVSPTTKAVVKPQTENIMIANKKDINESEIQPLKQAKQEKTDFVEVSNNGALKNEHFNFEKAGRENPFDFMGLTTEPLPLKNEAYYKYDLGKYDTNDIIVSRLQQAEGVDNPFTRRVRQLNSDGTATLSEMKEQSNRREEGLKDILSQLEQEQKSGSGMATILGKNIYEAEADRITREAKEEAIKAIQPNSSQEKKREVMNNEAKQKRAEIKKAFESNKLNEKLMKEIVDKPTSKQEAVRKLLKTPPPKKETGDNFIPKSVSKKAEEKESKKKAEEAVTEKKKGRPSGSLNKPPTEKLFESLSKIEQIRFLESEGVNIKDIPSSSKKGNLLKSDLMEFYKSNIIGRK